MNKVLIRLAAVLVLLEAILFFVLLVVVVMAEDVDTGERWITNDDLPALGGLFLSANLLCLWAAVAMWRLHLFGAGVGVPRAVVSVIAVLAVLAANGYGVLAVLVSTAGDGLDSLNLLTGIYAAFVVLGCVLAFRTSFKPDQPGSHVG